MHEFWNDPFYKPKTEVCEEFWWEFMRCARLLNILWTNGKKEWELKYDSPYPYDEPSIYHVFNKMRQDMHDELPYSENFLKIIDREVENDIKRERKKKV